MLTSTPRIHHSSSDYAKWLALYSAGWVKKYIHAKTFQSEWCTQLVGFEWIISTSSSHHIAFASLCSKWNSTDTKKHQNPSGWFINVCKSLAMLSFRNAIPPKYPSSLRFLPSWWMPKRCAVYLLPFKKIRIGFSHIYMYTLILYYIS